MPIALAGFVAAAPATAADEGVQVVTLRADGRSGDLIGLGNASPSLSWEFAETDAAAADGCRGDAERLCPADRQTAYQVRAAATAGDLEDGPWLWNSGQVESRDQVDIDWGGVPLESRDQVFWQVRVWDALGEPSAWSEPQHLEIGLLDNADWEPARWIENHTRAEDDPLPIFARELDIEEGLESARLYLSGVGQHLATVNGEGLTDEVLAPGNSNYQLSSEYRTYDITGSLQAGENVVGVELGHGPAYVRRNITNEDVGRTDPYSWWESQYTGDGELLADVEAGAQTVLLDDVEGYFVGGTINVDVGDGGERLESRVITEIGTPGLDGTGITFQPGLNEAHAAGSQVTGSGDNVADVDPAAGAAVSPRFIGRIELTYEDGTTETVVTDREWRTATGALVTDAWYSGADFDDRRVQEGWNEPGADHGEDAERRDGSPMDWTNAGIAPPPNLATELVARNAENVTIIDEFEPVEITNPSEGTWVFDFGQNMAGLPLLQLHDALPAGTTIRMTPAASLNEDGTVNQEHLGIGGRGTDVFQTYTTSGRENETWHPDFNYSAMQWVQLDGLPADFEPDEDTVRALQISADVEQPGTLETSNDRVNRVERMSRYSVLSNVQSVITDTPGREKLSYPADYTQPMGFIHRQVDLSAYLYTTMRHLVESQSIDDTYMRGNIPLKAPVYDWGYTRRFGDEINWGNSIVLVPWMVYELYGDTSLMEEFYDEMKFFVEYIQREKVGTGEDEHIVDAALADWVSANQTSGEITGTWGYHQTIDRMARMAELTGRDDDAAAYAALREEIRDAFNERFYNEELQRYTFVDDEDNVVATQAAQALPLDSGIVEEENREAVTTALAELVEEFSPEGDGPHFSAGTIGMAPVVRALSEAGYDDLLWEVLQQDTYPSYGYFMEPTVENPDGMTTVGERWTRGDSKNHMILAQIDEWFHAGLAGIRQAPGSVAYREVIVEPTVVGDLTWVDGTYQSPAGEIASSWQLDEDSFRLDVVVPANTDAEVRVPTDVVDGELVASYGIEPVAVEGEHAVFEVSSGSYTFGVGIELRDEVTPEAVTFADEDGTEEDTYTVPAVEGVEYLVDGEVIEAGTHPGSGTVTVTAQALEGYVLAEGATAEWSYTFSSDGGGQPGPDRRSAEFHLSNTWRGSTDVFFMYGRWADEVLIGDWDGDGVDTIAVRRENEFHVTNAQRGGDADVVLTYGRPGDVILVGDWDGDGVDTFAVRRGDEYHVKNSLRGGDADVVFTYGRDGDQVLVGDWDGDATDTFAVRRGAVYHVKNSLRGGDADVVFAYGRAADVTLTGDWDGDGDDTLAVRRGATYHVNNSLRGGDADIVVTFGRSGDEVHVGDWDGNGTDTLGVRRPVGGHTAVVTGAAGAAKEVGSVAKAS